MSRKIFMRYPGGLGKALTLSYDDGVEQDLKLMEILDRHGIKCTFNINSGCYAPEGKVYAPGTVHRRLPESAVTEAYAKNGHEVAVHALTHPHLELLSPANITYEVLQDRLNLEHQFGVTVRGMAYPYGTYSDTVVECLRACGIAYSRTVVSTENFDLPTDWLRMPATCHHANPRLEHLAKKFSDMEVNDAPRLFYLWGHSYEFERDGNWDVIERFAEEMGNRSDIWYATNLEIYDYVQDYQRLIWSADGARVTNPTARMLFLKYGNQLVKIAPGATELLEG